MGFFRPKDENKPVDDDIRSLIDDIDASLADFDKRLAAERSRAAKPVRVAPSASNLDKLELPPEAEAAGASEGAGSLLDELAQEVGAQAGALALSAQERQERARRIHDALLRISKYFGVFCRHTNALQPPIPRTYRIDEKTAYADLHWHEAMVKARKESLSELALLEMVSFRVRFMAPAPLTIRVRNDKLAAFKRDLHVLDLRIAEGMELDGVPDDTGTTFRLAPDFPVQMTFEANCNDNRIEVTTRNLESFGISAFACSPEEVTQELLDGIGRYLLARDNRLPTVLRRTQHRAEI